MTTKKTPGRKAAAPAAETAAKAPAKRAPRAKKAAAAGVKLFIDFPRPNETVRPGGYTFRIGAVPAASRVEVSLDGGPWLPCREGAGYWWYDWSAYTAGSHRLAVRAPAAGDEARAEREFDVKAALVVKPA